MANVLKYLTGILNKRAVRRGNLAVGVGEENYGPSSETGYFSGVTPPEGGYVIYTTGVNDNPKIFSATTENDLPAIARTLGGGVMSVADSMVYISSLPNTWILDKIPNNIITEGLVLNLNASNISSYPGYGNSWHDMTSGGNDGVLTNGPTFESNGSIVFDGVNDKVQTSYAPRFGDFTVTIIFKDNGSGGWGRIVDKGYQSGFFISSYFATYGKGFVGCGIIEPVPPHGVALPYSSGKYHFFTSVRNGTLQTIYLDGIEQTNSRIVSSALLNSETLAFGTWNVNTSQPFKGNLAAAMVYDRALSPSEIQHNYYGGSIVTDGLIRALDFSNLVCYESGGSGGDDLTFNDTFSLINSPVFTKDFGGGMKCDTTNEFVVMDNVCATNYVTVELVYRRDSAANNVDDIVLNKENCWEIKDRGGDLAWAVYTSNRGWFWQDTGANIAVGETAHIVLTYDGNKVDFYKNGELTLSYNYPSGGVLAYQTSAYPKFNSRATSKNTAQYPGNHTAFTWRIYDRALSSSEILQNFNAQKARFGL